MVDKSIPSKLENGRNLSGKKLKGTHNAPRTGKRSSTTENFQRSDIHNNGCLAVLRAPFPASSPSPRQSLSRDASDIAWSPEGRGIAIGKFESCIHFHRERADHTHLSVCVIHVSAKLDDCLHELCLSKRFFGPSTWYIRNPIAIFTNIHSNQCERKFSRLCNGPLYLRPQSQASKCGRNRQALLTEVQHFETIIHKG